MFALLASVSPSEAQDLNSAQATPAMQASAGLQVAEVPPAAEPMAPAAAAQPIPLTPEVLAAYVARQRQKSGFDMFGDAPSAQSQLTAQLQPQLTGAMVLAYADSHFENAALAAINGAAAAVPLAETFSFSPQAVAMPRGVPSITDDALARYVRSGFEPTVKRIQQAVDERNCLSTAIYREARGESEDGQWAVANVIINRAMSNRFPGTLCGVVYQNANQGLYRCQFTFACDGHAEKIMEREAWYKAQHIAAAAFSEFQHGKRPGVIPGSALYYHTRSVSTDWNFRQVAEIGAHIFYAPL
jgi:spore germination cell wall hydrolase CwlJ-like protein